VVRGSCQLGTVHKEERVRAVAKRGRDTRKAALIECPKVIVAPSWGAGGGERQWVIYKDKSGHTQD